MTVCRTAVLLFAGALAFGPAPGVALQSGGLDLLALPAGARAASLAEALTAAGPDLEAVLYNPAAILGAPAALAVSRADAPDLYEHYVLAGGAPVRGAGHVAAFVRVATFDPIPLLDDAGAPLGEASPQALAIGVAAAYRILPPLDAGLALKFVSVDLLGGQGDSGRGTGVAFDLGATVRPLPTAPVSIGAALLDFGPNLTIGEVEDPLPRRLRLGIGIEPLALLHDETELPVRVLLLVDREQGLASDVGGEAFRVGAEMWVVDALALRGGVGPDAGGGTRQVFGFGVSARRFRLDLAYEPAASPALEDQTHVSLGIRL